MAIAIMIRHIVRIRRMLRSWLRKATSSSFSSHDQLPPDVPEGHVAVCVGSTFRRFVVRATHLNHPVFRQLLLQAEEEYGFSCNVGPLLIPCNESLFEEILSFLSQGKVTDPHRRCHVAYISFFGESRPLLYA